LASVVLLGFVIHLLLHLSLRTPLACSRQQGGYQQAKRPEDDPDDHA